MEVEFDARSLLGADNSAISQWDDTSGNARHATQGDGSLQPTVQTNELNSLQVARFVPVDHLNWSGNADALAFTVIAVMKCTDSASPRTILSANTGTIPTIWISSQKLELVNTDVAILATGGTTLSTSLFYTVGVTYNGATGAYALYVNGASDGSGTASAISFSRFHRLGSRNGNQNSFQGDIAYAALWNSVLSGGELTTRFNDLRTVWAHY
jgi:hypothetical protein